MGSEKRDFANICVCVCGGQAVMYLFDFLLGFETEAVPGPCDCDGD